jgi:Na+/proline symporter
MISLVFLVTRFLGDGVRVFAGAIPLALLTGWSVPTAIIALGSITLVYTWIGGIKAVIWADVVQLCVYVAGGIASLIIATHLAGGASHAWSMAQAAGKLHLFDFSLSLTAPYTFLGGLIGGALLSAASHGTDHVIVQRLLGTRSLRDARFAIVGSGVIVILQFLLFLLVGVALWASQNAAPDVPRDELFSQFILHHLPVGLSGLVIAGVLAAAMSSHSSAISALASSFTHDQYASWTGERDSGKLLQVGRLVSLVWGTALIAIAIAFYLWAGGTNTPVVVTALSIASVAYGALLGAYLLGGAGSRMQGRDVILGTSVAMVIMLVTFFSSRLAAAGLTQFTALGKLAFPWYVPMGMLLTLGVAFLSSRLHRAAPVSVTSSGS